MNQSVFSFDKIINLSLFSNLISVCICSALLIFFFVKISSKKKGWWLLL